MHEILLGVILRYVWMFAEPAAGCDGPQEAAGDPRRCHAAAEDPAPRTLCHAPQHAPGKASCRCSAAYIRL